MPRMKWSELTTQQLGQYGEYFAKMEFASYGYDVYTSEVDDHGVDFVVKEPDGSFYEVQVKSVRQDNYLPIPHSKFQANFSDRFLICYIRFKDEEMPKMYLIPTSAWNTPNALLPNYLYDKGQKSDPEIGINYNQKNAPLLEEWKAENFFEEGTRR